MSPELATVIVSVIGLIGTIVTALISKRQKAIKATVDKQNIFINKEKGIRQKLNQKQKEKEDTIHEVMIVILDTNIAILRNNQDNDNLENSEIYQKSEKLKKRFADISDSMDDIYKEYEIVLEMTKTFEAEMNKDK